jgi:DNA transformation protein
MAVSNSYLTYVLDQLHGLPGLVTKGMFGGVGLYSSDVFFGVIDNDTLFFKVDTDLARQYQKLGMPPFQPIPGKAAMGGYYQVPPTVLENADELRNWARQSINVAVKKGPRVQGPKGPTVRSDGRKVRSKNPTIQRGRR